MEHIYLTKGKQLAAVIILVIICMACGKEADEHEAAIAEKSDADALLPEEEFGKITDCLDEQVFGNEVLLPWFQDETGTEAACEISGQDMHIVVGDVKVIEKSFYAKESAADMDSIGGTKFVTEWEMRYPYFLGENVTRFNDINDQIFEYVLECCKRARESIYEGGLTYEVTYMDDQFVSILFEGCAFYQYSYGMSFDLKTEKILSLEDFYAWPEWKALMEEAIEQDQLSVRIGGSLSVEKEGEKEYLQEYFIPLFEENSHFKQENIFFFIRDGYLYFIAPEYPSFKDPTYVKWEVPLDMEKLTDTDIVEQKEELPGSFNLTALYDADVVSDFLSRDTEVFEKQYDKKALYEKDMLYCTKEAWKYDGGQLDGFQNSEDYYEVEDIRAIRFINLDMTDTNTYAETDDIEDVKDRVILQCFEDYAVSMYFQKINDVQGKDELKLVEVSFVKVTCGEADGGGTALKELYEFLEKEYYEVQEEIEKGEWVLSPEKKKAVCITNGALPKHPSQIFVRCQEKTPDLVFRRTWECHFADWIDENHFICYNDFGPYLIHLETNQVEEIKTEADDYDAYGCKYEIRKNQLAATVMGEEFYRWDIVGEDGEIRLVKKR